MTPSRTATVSTGPTRWERGDLAAALYRELLLLTRNRTNLLLAIMPTVIYIVLFATSLARLIPSVRYGDVTISYPDFAIPGLMLSSLLAASAAAATALFQERIGNMTVELWSSPLRRSRYVAAKLLASAGLVTVQALGALLASTVLFRARWSADRWAAVLLSAVVAALAFSGLYLLLAVHVREFERFMVLVNIVTPALLFGSPSFYPSSHMAPPLRWLANLNPVTYGVAGLRDGLVLGIGAALPYVALMAGMAIVTSVLVARALRRGNMDL